MAQESKFSERLDSLRIDRSRRRPEESGWAKWWILIGIVLLIAFGLWRFTLSSSPTLIDVLRVRAETSGSSGAPTVLDAAGYIVAHHKIEVASKVVGRVAWIGVEKGDAVRKGQVVVRLEDDEYRARVRQAEGNLASLQARLAELEAGTRPEEIERSRANLAAAKADQARLELERDRSQQLVDAGVLAAQEKDRAQEEYNAQAARVAALERAWELAKLGPRREEIAAARGLLKQAAGQLDYSRTQLEAAVIRAPVTGTILERNVEIGEFVTTSFVGERGAKGYVVSLADLDDLQVELDISQDDFARLSMGQEALVTADAYRDRQYDGEIVEISPEADRQKATVQVKVQILEPDAFLRPEMNANVAFRSAEQPTSGTPERPMIRIPASAVRGGQVFLFVSEAAVARSVEIRPARSGQVDVLAGLTGGEDLILDPPPDLADGDAVQLRTP